MATDSTGTKSQSIRGRLLRYQSHIAAVMAAVVVGAMLAALEAVSVPLEAGQTLRESGAAALAGGEPVYTAYSGVWLAVRALLGLYIVFVVIIISALALVVWKEVLD